MQETGPLFDAAGRNLQQPFFYNDADGIYSFQVFLSPDRGRKDWAIEDRGTYIVLRSLGKGRQIQIYANKPTTEQGQQEIRAFFLRNKLQPTVIVHRGHSYHAINTITQIPTTALLV